MTSAKQASEESNQVRSSLEKELRDSDIANIEKKISKAIQRGDHGVDCIIGFSEHKTLLESLGYGLYKQPNETLLYKITWNN